MLALAVGAGWATVNYGPFGKTQLTTSACADLRTFITSEESTGKSKWDEYRSLVKQYESASKAIDRVPLVKQIAMTMIDVLGHDLAIYKELNKNSSCVLQSKRKDIAAMITDTESAINFLNGSTPINGTYFNPDLGTWNTGYYAEYVTAIDFLKK